MFDKSYLKKDGFVLVDCSRKDFIIVGKSWQQEFGVPDYVVSTVRKQEVKSE